MNQILESQHTPHTSPSRARYGVSIVMILAKIDHVITAPHYIVAADDLMTPIVPSLALQFKKIQI